MSEFFIRALLGGILMAIASAPIGCFLLWRRMAYFGDALSHSILLGVSLGLFFNFPPSVGAIFIAIIFSLLVVLLRKKHSHDSILGILSYSSLALSLIVTSFMPKMRVDITSYLFGDILLIDQEDIIYLLLLGVTILLVLKYRWRQLVIATVSEDIAQTEGINVTRINLEFMVLISILVAISFKIIGILLITAMLIIPAAAARNFSNSPVQMIIMSVTISIMSVVTALSLSLEFDLPSGATIITIAFVFFIISNIHKLLKPS